MTTQDIVFCALFLVAIVSDLDTIYDIFVNSTKTPYKETSTFYLYSDDHLDNIFLVLAR